MQEVQLFFQPAGGENYPQRKARAYKEASQTPYVLLPGVLVNMAAPGMPGNMGLYQTVVFPTAEPAVSAIVCVNEELLGFLGISLPLSTKRSSSTTVQSLTAKHFTGWRTE